jgi:hypothetical protein
MSAVVETPLPVPQERAVASPDTLAAGSYGNGAAGLPIALAIFVSAFLLFQVQLILGKEVLPLFGGASAVWTVCVFVFELLFLAGYGYSHALATWLPVRKQAILHGAILGASAVFLGILGYVRSAPIGPRADWRPQPGASPTWTIIEFLLSSIGLPFVLLSATSPLLQHWAAQIWHKKAPYRLYALSNVGSLLGLLSYPVLIEPYIGLRAQRWVWAAGYGLFLACYLFSAGRAMRSAFPAAAKEKLVPDLHAGEPPAGWASGMLWLSLAACASVLLLATTNLICQDIAVSPFLWVLALSLYLLSFVLCFDSDRWYRREIFFPAFAATVGWVIVVSLPGAEYTVLTQLAAYSALLFTGCMVCHGEVARARPPAESLTAYYLCIAAGGVVGGLAVSLVAPGIFPNYWEYPLGVLGCMAALLGVSMQDRSSWWYKGRASLAFLILTGVALLLPAVLAPLWGGVARWPRSVGLYAGAALAGVAAWRYAIERRAPLAAPSPGLVRNTSRVLLALLTAGLVIPQKSSLYHVIAYSRNFYGVLSVVSVEKENYLVLRDGSTVHGIQYQDAQRARLATGYYGPASGANLVIRNWPQHPMRVGLVGMGIGTLATLAQPGDVYRFYEINPDVHRLSSGAQPYFTYLRDSPGRIEVVPGDARLSLEREAERGDTQKFDVLVLDAFSSDAIPMHLLTREAFRLYARHLRAPSSVIAVHISNQTVDLRPVLAGIAGNFGFHALRVYPLDPSGPFSQSDWVLLSLDPVSLSGGDLSRHSEPFPAGIQPISWTDDYFNLLRIIRW